MLFFRHLYKLKITKRSEMTNWSQRLSSKDTSFSTWPSTQTRMLPRLIILLLRRIPSRFLPSNKRRPNERAKIGIVIHNPLVDLTDIESISVVSPEDGSVALASASASGYCGGQQPRTAHQKSKMLTARVIKIYGFSHDLDSFGWCSQQEGTHEESTTHLAKQDQRHQFSSRPAWSRSIPRMCFSISKKNQGRRGDGYSMGYCNMHITHICKDEMSTTLFTLLHILCKDKNIHKKYPQVIHDGLGEGYVSLYNLCRSLNFPCLRDSNLMASDIPKQKATESKSIYIAWITRHLMEEKQRNNEISNDKALHLVMKGLHQTCRVKLTRYVNDMGGIYEVDVYSILILTTRKYSMMSKMTTPTQLEMEDVVSVEPTTNLMITSRQSTSPSCPKPWRLTLQSWKDSWRKNFSSRERQE
jgi:hypothetical protein